MGRKIFIVDCHDFQRFGGVVLRKPLSAGHTNTNRWASFHFFYPSLDNLNPLFMSELPSQFWHSDARVVALHAKDEDALGRFSRHDAEPAVAAAAPCGDGRFVHAEALRVIFKNIEKHPAGAGRAVGVVAVAAVGVQVSASR